MRAPATILIAALLAGLTFAAVPKKGSGKKGSSAAKSSTKKSTGKKKGSGKATTWRNRQLAPTPDRYKQIQQALAEKGYLKKEANGVWDQESVDALRRFQEDQSLQATGKLESVSLIALGLGPRRETVPTPPQPTPR
jgi:hypothetical protein